MPADSLAGTTVSDKYEVLEEVGKGRVGVVYKATHMQLDRLVAIKVLFEDVGGKEVSFRRFEREARASGSLNHPNIITVFDFGVSPSGFPYLVMEYIEGADLQKVVGMEGRFQLPRTLKIVSQVCSALGHAHKRGIVHRDLKPSNIMLVDIEDMPDYVKLVDFGIAKHYDAEEDTIERLTMEGQILGTPAYMSPEQCSAKKLDARSDIYSLGCVIYKMLTGSTPITGTSLIEIMQNHVKARPMTFAEVSRDINVPLEIEKVVMKALNKEPHMRQQSMAEFKNELNSAFGICAESAPQSVFMPSNPEAAGMQGRTYEVLLDAAVRGDTMAQYQLALRLEHGDGVAADLEEAAKWLRSAAQGAQKEAQFRLGKQFLNGEDGMARSPEEGVRWLIKAAEQGYEPAESLLGNCYEDGRGVGVSLPEAIRWYRAAIKHGNRQLEARLSNCYLRCQEMGSEAEGLLEWLGMKALEGDTEAMFALGRRYQVSGTSGEERERAVDYLHEAAKKGHPQAQIRLAHAYLSGDGATANAAEAFNWFSKAAEQGDAEAITWQAVCYKNGIGVNADPLKTAQTLHKAVEAGYTEAKALMGASMLVGDAMPRQIPRGIALLKAAADEGSSFAQWKYALCCASGLGMLRDPKEAEKWFDKSSDKQFDQGLPWPSSAPGLNFSDAIKVFQTLSNIQHKLGLYWLGLCHELGLSVPKDLRLALEFYTKSADKGHPPAIQAAARIKALFPSSPTSGIFPAMRSPGFS